MRLARGYTPLCNKVHFIMRARRPVRNLGRDLGLICCAAGLALSLPAVDGRVQAQTQAAGEASLSARINAEFQEVKTSVAEMQKQAPRLDQALETFAAHLKARTDLSADEKAAVLARVEQARAVLRSHGETVRRAAARFNGATAGADMRQDIAALAELLNVEGDKLVNAVTDQTASKTGDLDLLAAAHSAYRKAVTALVDAARKMQEDSKNNRETSTGKAENR
jgi:hypothetical protein